jgi:hypothetical protein
MRAQAVINPIIVDFVFERGTWWVLAADFPFR